MQTLGIFRQVYVILDFDKIIITFRILPRKIIRHNFYEDLSLELFLGLFKYAEVYNLIFVGP